MRRIVLDFLMFALDFDFYALFFLYLFGSAFVIRDFEYDRLVRAQVENELILSAVAQLFLCLYFQGRTVGISREHALIYAVRGRADAHFISFHGREVTDENQRVVIVPRVAPYKREYIAVIISAVDPLERAVSSAVIIENGARPVQVKQSAVTVEHVAVPFVVAEEPIEPRFEVPLPLLREVLTHKQKFFAGVPHHHSITGFQAAELVGLAAYELVYHTAFAVHYFVVRENEHIIFVERVLEQVGYKSVVIGSENRVGVVVLYGIVHPAHIPFEPETETALFSGFGDTLYNRGILGY